MQQNLFEGESRDSQLVLSPLIEPPSWDSKGIFGGHNVTRGSQFRTARGTRLGTPRAIHFWTAKISKMGITKGSHKGSHLGTARGPHEVTWDHLG